MCLLTEGRVGEESGLITANFLEARAGLIFRCDISLSRWTYWLVVLLAVLYSSNTAVRAQESSKTGFSDSVTGISPGISNHE